MDKFNLDLVLLALLFWSCLFDLAQRRIPNRLLAIALVGALALHLAYSPPAALLTTYLAGMGVGLVMFLPVYLLGGMAAGDVKLMATVGAFTGPAMALEICLLSYVAGGVMAVLIVVCRGRVREAVGNLGALLRPMVMRMRGIPAVAEPMPGPSVGGMPYALAITAGTVAMLWIRHT